MLDSLKPVAYLSIDSQTAGSHSMTLNADFSQVALVHSEDIAWRPSPMPGVDRRMLDRIGDEVARATSIVRYAPESAFSAHTHGGGEEFIVLDGVFQDEHGAYPAGTYVRNPPTTSHTPRSDQGCTIFVKLWQFQPDDRTQFSTFMADEVQEVSAGLGLAELHKDDFETVRYFEADAGVRISLNEPGGTEVLIIEGDANHGDQTLKKRSWLRLPDGTPLDLVAGPGGAKLWVKTGHLVHARAPDA